MKTYTDLTLDESHVITKIARKIAEVIPNHVFLTGTSVIVDIEDNYDNLGYAKDEICRSPTYAHYINEKQMYRTQMTSYIPTMLQSLKELEDKNYTTSTNLVIPGIVYRRDVTDKYHVPAPHQMDIWLLSDEIKYTISNLHDLIKNVLNAIIPNCEYRTKDTLHHYTDNGIEVEVLYEGKWIEVLECGLAGRRLLDKYGLTNYTGLAMGIGLDRIAMLLKSLPDIRLLRSEKYKNQMQTWDKYIALSNQPTIKRDLSIAIEKDTALEDLCEIIRLNDNTTWVQNVEILSITDYDKLPEPAIKKLGMTENQQNYLIRITLQDLDKTLTSEEANLWYKNIYQKLHKGNNWVYLTTMK